MGSGAQGRVEDHLLQGHGASQPCPEQSHYPAWRRWEHGDRGRTVWAATPRTGKGGLQRGRGEAAPTCCLRHPPKEPLGSWRPVAC